MRASKVALSSDVAVEILPDGGPNVFLSPRRNIYSAVALFPRYIYKYILNNINVTDF